MGCRGSSSGIKRAVKASQNSMSLQDTIAQTENRLNAVKDQLYEIARKHTPWTMPEEYYDLQKEKQKFQGELSKLYQKRTEENEKKAAAERPPKRYVNGYGEATHREIASLSYKRAMARQERDFDRWFGRGMEEFHKRKK